VIGENARNLWLGVPVRVPIHVYRLTSRPASESSIMHGRKAQVLYLSCVKITWSQPHAVEPVFLLLLQIYVTSHTAGQIMSPMY